MGENDRELLELAAKAAAAAGMPIIQTEFGPQILVRRLSDGTEEYRIWPPITDDGDALRLAVRLKINLEHMKKLSGAPFGINAWPVGRGDCGVSEDDPYLSDPNAATRRAITRAAAEIGKAMP